MGTTLRPDRGLPVEIGGVTFHFLYTFAVIDELQELYDAPMSVILDKLTKDRRFYSTAGHIIDALIKSDLYNNGETNAPSYDQIMHVLTLKDVARIIEAIFKAYSSDMPDKTDEEIDDDDDEAEKINVARLLVIARTEMKMSEEEFWKITPRKYFKLFDEYVELKAGTKKTRKKKGGSIDDLP